MTGQVEVPADPRGFLSGIKVVDLSFHFPGPFSTYALSELGADVVKIEPVGGEPGRRLSPAQHRHLNEFKEILELDLKSESGRARALETMAGADVVVEGFRPGVADRLGLGFAEVREVAPQVVYCSISGYGPEGSMRDVGGHDMAYEARGGAFHPAVVAGERPNPPVLPTADLGSSLYAALTIVAALRDPDRTACHLDISMQDVSVSLAFPRWGNFYLTGEDGDINQFGHLNPGYGIYETADSQFIVLAAVEEKFWVNLCNSLNRPDLCEPPLDSLSTRLQRRTEVSAAVGEEVAKRTLSDLTALFGANDVPLAEIRSAREVSEDPDLLQSGMIVPGPDGVRIGFPVQKDGKRLGRLAPQSPAGS